MAGSDTPMPTRHADTDDTPTPDVALAGDGTAATDTGDHIRDIPIRATGVCTLIGPDGATVPTVYGLTRVDADGPRHPVVWSRGSDDGGD